ncbi:MAG: GtrA family protein [Clostridiales bacterium]|nr:GtrA family protein [Clostridiales bacterium]
MLLPGLKVLNPFYRKYKEQLLYVLFGGLTFLVNLVVFSLFHLSVGWNELVANVAAWVFAVLFAYVTNKIWVFCSRGLSRSETLAELIKFFAGRFLTLVVEEIILFVFISCLHFASMPVKVVGQIVVILLNYIISRLFVFHK